jgi:hypothetical protein
MLGILPGHFPKPVQLAVLGVLALVVLGGLLFGLHSMSPANKPFWLDEINAL